MSTTRQQPHWWRPWWVWLSVPLLALVGTVDYLTGWELSFSIFYLAPISLAAWLLGKRAGVVASVCGAAVWLAVDLASAHYTSNAVAFWNASVRLAFFLIFTILLDILRTGRDNLEQAVRQRTQELARALDDLRAEVKQRLDAEEKRRLAEYETLHVTEREQRRMGQDLHDSVQGNLVGLRIMLGNLKSRCKPECGLDDEFDKLRTVVIETIEQTRALAACYSPDRLVGDGLRLALRKLAGATTALFRVPCEFHSDGAVNIADEVKASHLYHIAREAATNALKHSRANKIAISLSRRNGNISLTVEDDGIGMPADSNSSEGMGLHAMSSRASAIGAKLSIGSRSEGGTVVECVLPDDCAESRPGEAGQGAAG